MVTVLLAKSQQQNGNWQISFYGLDGHGNVEDVD